MGVGHVEADGYTIRDYEGSDRSDVLALYERVTGRAGDPWLRWKHETNPYVDDVPITVAVRDGRVVAARSGFVLPLRAGNGRYLALQLADALVAPDHRGAGLLDRATDRLCARYESGEPDLLVAFRTGGGEAGGDARGERWRVAGTVPTYRRVQRPSRLVDSVGTARSRLAVGAADTCARAYLSARDALTERPADVTVERERGVATRGLLSAYRTERPAGWHALRDSRYYAWRYENPGWHYRTYLVRADHGVVAALVVGRRPEGDRVAVVEALPLSGDRRRIHQFGALVDRAIADHPDAAVASVCGDRLPRDLLASRGFVGAERWPLSRVTEPATLAVRPLSDDTPWRADGLSLDDVDDWALTFAEHDAH